MSVCETKRLKQLEEENARLNQIVADLTLDMTALKDVLLKTGEARSATPSGAAFCATVWFVSTAGL